MRPFLLIVFGVTLAAAVSTERPHGIIKTFDVFGENKGQVTKTIQVQAILAAHLKVTIHAFELRVSTLADQFMSLPRSKGTQPEDKIREVKAMITQAWEQDPGLTKVKQRTKTNDPIAKIVAKEWMRDEESLYMDTMVARTRKGVYEMQIKVWCPQSPCFVTLNLVGMMLNEYALLSLNKQMLYTNEEVAWLRTSSFFQRDLEKLLITRTQGEKTFVTAVKIENFPLEQLFIPNTRGVLYNPFNPTHRYSLRVPDITQSDLIHDDPSDALSFTDHWPEDMKDSYFL